jgi:hypothetical protein
MMPLLHQQHKSTLTPAASQDTDGVAVSYTVYALALACMLALVVDTPHYGKAASAHEHGLACPVS